jgi:transposase
VQADAKNTYDVLFRKPDPAFACDDSEARHEVGCWSHARRKFYEAAIEKDPIARQGLWRIHKLFELEKGWKDEPPAKRKALREQHSRPILDAFFAWAEVEYTKVKDCRGLLRTAFGYAVRHQGALRRFLDDGRLRLENNVSERALRAIAVGRKAWLFVGSDDHAEAAANLFSLIASCKLHGLDPEAYLRDLFRILVHWPRDRYLELAPRYWAATRARLNAGELKLPLGSLTVPDAPAKQAAAG